MLTTWFGCPDPGLINFEGWRFSFVHYMEIQQLLYKAFQGWVKKNGEGGIRTRGAGDYPHDGLANRCLKPLGHLSTFFSK